MPGVIPPNRHTPRSAALFGVFYWDEADSPGISTFCIKQEEGRDGTKKRNSRQVPGGPGPVRLYSHVSGEWVPSNFRL